MKSIELSDEQEKEVVNIICDCCKVSKDRYSNFYSLCNYLEKLYQVKLPDDLKADLEEENPGLMPADQHVGVNELLALLDDILFSSDPFLRCVGGQNVSERTIRNVTSYLTTAVAHSQFKRAYRPTLKSTIMFGGGWGYVDAEEISLDVLTKDIDTTAGSLRYRDLVRDKIFICPTYKRCELRRFFPDPDNVKPRWAIYQAKGSLLDLLEDEGKDEELRKYDADMDAIKKSTFPKADFEEFLGSSEFKSSIMKDYNQPVELLHFRGWIPIPSPNANSNEIPEFKDVIATLVNREVLIQFEESEWHYPAVEHFIPTFMFPEDDEMLYPISKLGASASAMLQKFYLRNRQLMSLARILNPPYWSDDKELPQYIEAKSGEVVRVARGCKLDSLKTADIPKEAYLEGNNITNEIQYIIGSNQFSAGVTPPREQLATGIMVLKGVTDAMRKFESKIIVDTGLTTIMRRYRDIGRLYADGMPVKMFDTKEVVEIAASDLDSDELDIEVKINDVWNHPIQRQEMLKLAEIYKDDPFIDPVELRRKHFRLIQFTDVEKLVPDPAEKMLPIDKENMMMVQGEIAVPVLPEEDHELHLQGHAKFKDHPLVAEHSEGHVAMMQQKEKPTKGGQPRIPLAKDEAGLTKQAVQLQPEMRE